MSRIYGCCYCFAALILILSAMASIALTGINLNNLMENKSFIYMLNFQYQGQIGPSARFCTDVNFLVFAWLSGFLSIMALFTGICAYIVKNPLSKFALFFLILCGMTAFATSILNSVAIVMVLFCHVTQTSLIPSGTLFIGIFAVLQSIMSMICFFKVCARRAEDALDLKYGIEPIPDPWNIETSSRAIIVEGKPPIHTDGRTHEIAYESPFINYNPIPVGYPTLPPAYSSSTFLTNNPTGSSHEENKVILNNTGGVRTNYPLPPIPRQQFVAFSDSSAAIKPFTIDRVSCPPSAYPQHRLPYNCKQLA